MTMLSIQTFKKFDVRKKLLEPRVLAKDLILFRCIFLSILFLQIIWDYKKFLSLFFLKKDSSTIYIFELIGGLQPSEISYQMAHFMFAVFCVFAIIGIVGRFSIFMTLVSIFYIFATRIFLQSTAGHEYLPCSDQTCMLALLVLCFYPKEGLMGFKKLLEPTYVATTSAWPLRLVIFTISMAYISAAYSKLMLGGLDWISAATIQEAFLRRYLYFPQGYQSLLASASYSVICGGIAWLTISFELTFIVTIFSKAARLIYIPMGILFHAAIYMFMDINFFMYFVPLYFVFLRWEHIHRLWGKLGNSRIAN